MTEESKERYRVIFKETNNGPEKCTERVGSMKTAEILLSVTEELGAHSAWIEKVEIVV